MNQVIVFDFDGVIVDSNRIKEQAYYQIFSHVQSAEDVIEKIIAEFKNATRFVIIKNITDSLIKKNLLKTGSNRKTLVDNFTNRYSQIVDNYIIETAEIKGMCSFLERLCEVSSLHINSGTPRANLLKIVKSMQLDKYFVDILGYPPSKSDNLSNIIKKNRLKHKNVLYIGDSLIDYQAADKNRVTFISFRDNFGYKGLVAKNLKELEKIVNSWLEEKNIACAFY